MKTKHYTYWIKLSMVIDKNVLFLTITCEYAISYKNSRHNSNLVAAYKLRNTVLD
jgi:hypothetical protein